MSYLISIGNLCKSKTSFPYKQISIGKFYLGTGISAILTTPSGQKMGICRFFLAVIGKILTFANARCRYLISADECQASYYLA